MIGTVLTIVLCIVGVLMAAFGFIAFQIGREEYKLREEKKAKDEIEIDKLKQSKDELVSKTEILKDEVDYLQRQKEQAFFIKQQYEEELEKNKEFIAKEYHSLAIAKNEKLEHDKQVSKDAYVEYCKTLDNAYELKEREFDDKVDYLLTLLEDKKQDATIQIDHIQQLINEQQGILDEISATRAAAQQAVTREKEIKEKKQFYCLTATATDLDDIKALERVKNQLHKPRILSMLIWSTYWQKPMNTLCNNVIGPGIHCGIYKITNQETSECYIGQSKDISRRWKDHAKCMLQIDAPPGNKLYAAGDSYGIWNFSWEVLEECNPNELDDKERFYIELYQSDKFGYNSTAGNNKK